MVMVAPVVEKILRPNTMQKGIIPKLFRNRIKFVLRQSNYYSIQWYFNSFDRLNIRFNGCQWYNNSIQWYNNSIQWYNNSIQWYNNSIPFNRIFDCGLLFTHKFTQSKSIIRLTSFVYSIRFIV